MSRGLPALTVQQLEYLVAVVEAPTWADAAKTLGVSPSALSQGIGQLERRLGVPLFDREGRRRVLQPGVDDVVAYARRVVAATRDLGRWAEATRSGAMGQLRVGMIDVAAVNYFGATLQGFRHAHPQLDLQLVVAPSGSLVEQLLAGSIALAVLVRPEHPTGDLELLPLLDEELALYAPAGVRLPAPTDWGPWVTFPAGSHTRGLVARRLAEFGAPFEVVAESHQPEVLRGMVELGMGWTVLPVIQAEAEPLPLRRLRPEPLLVRRLVVARRHERLSDPAADALVERLRERSGPSPTGRCG